MVREIHDGRFKKNIIRGSIEEDHEVQRVHNGSMIPWVAKELIYLDLLRYKVTWKQMYPFMRSMEGVVKAPTSAAISDMSSLVTSKILIGFCY